MNILDKIGLAKEKISLMAGESLKNGWINEGEHKELIQKLETQRIIIGVVGQMKYGKSTLINALIFGKKFLPTASTPMTATLTYITGVDEGAVEEYEVEFYTDTEWEEIERRSRERSPEMDGADCEIEAAKQLVKMAGCIKDEMPALIGQRKKISLDELPEYVAEKGRFVPVTKALNIRYPDKRLNGVDIVDTPGFNDPLPARENRAREFLSRADVVLVVLFAGRPFDASDRDIIFEKIRTVGAGKVVIIVNKYDSVLEEEGAVKKVMGHIEERCKSEIAQLKKEYRVISDIFKDSRPIPFSSLLALLGKMDIEDIKKDGDLNFHFDRYKKIFPDLKTQKDFLKLSRLADVEAEIEKIIKNDRIKILVNKPATFIMGKISAKIAQVGGNISTLTLQEKLLDRNKVEIEQESKNMKKVKKKVEDLLDSTLVKFEAQFLKIINTSQNKAKNTRDDLLKRYDEIVPERDWWKTISGYCKKCEQEIQTALSDFKKDFRNKRCELSNKIHTQLKEMLNEIDMQSDEIVSRHLEYSSSVFNDMKKKFLNILEAKIEIELDSEVTLDLGSWYHICWGINKADIIKKAREITRDRLSDEILCGPIDKMANIVMENNIKYMNENFEKCVIAPIDTTIEDAIRKHEDAKERVKQIGEEKAGHEREKELLGRKRKNFEEEIFRLLG